MGDIEDQKKDEKPIGRIEAMVAEISDYKERSNVKGVEIAKIGAVERGSVGNYDIEILSTNAIDGGVELYARAWSSSGEQIGFGKDGSVDIERFRFFNPPVKAFDGTFTDTVDDKGLPTTEMNYVEDPKLAILQSLSHTISVIPKHDDSNVVSLKLGNTTDTYYPSLDGNVTNYTGPSGDWTTTREAATGTAADYASAALYLKASNYGGTDPYDVQRCFFLFDTSALPDSASISAATVSVYTTGGVGNYTGQTEVLVQSSPASTTELVAGDFDQCGTLDTPTEGATRATPSANAYSDFALNASGLSWITVSGITKFGLRASKDVDNSAPTAAGYIQLIMAETAGTSTDPKLVITYTSAAGPTTVKTVNGAAVATVKTKNGAAWATVKSVNGAT